MMFRTSLRTVSASSDISWATWWSVRPWMISVSSVSSCGFRSAGSGAPMGVAVVAIGGGVVMVRRRRPAHRRDRERGQDVEGAVQGQQVPEGRAQ